MRRERDPPRQPVEREPARLERVVPRLEPAAVDVMVAAHLSPEPGHGLVLAELGLEPLLDLGLRLGEGTGALLAVPLLRAAVAVLAEMATFADAGVTDAGR